MGCRLPRRGCGRRRLPSNRRPWCSPPSYPCVRVSPAAGRGTRRATLGHELGHGYVMIRRETSNGASVPLTITEEPTCQPDANSHAQTYNIMPKHATIEQTFMIIACRILSPRVNVIAIFTFRTRNSIFATQIKSESAWYRLRHYVFRRHIPQMQIFPIGNDSDVAKHIRPRLGGRSIFR